MAGPYPPNYGIGSGIGSVGPIPPQHTGAYPSGATTGPMVAYPGPLAPPMPYPPRSRRRRVFGVVVAIVVVAALAALIGYAVRSDTSTATGDGRIITEAPAKTAIQDYLNALESRDTDTITRNTLCGIYDRVTDHRSDDAVAKMSSDAFRGQFSRAEVTSIDKIVHLSNFQAQVLFTMRVAPPRGGNAREDVQGLAQLLSVDHRVLVCSYVLRAAGFY